jgi:hypothetical protein
MIEGVFGGLASRVIIDAQQGLVSLIDVVEQTNVPTFATAGVQAYVIPGVIIAAASWLDDRPGEAGERTLSAEILDPGNEEVARVEFACPAWTNGRARTLATFQGVVVRREGVHRVVMRMSGPNGVVSAAHELRFYVSLVGRPNTQPG